MRPSYDLAGSYDPGTDHWPPPAKPPAGDTIYFLGVSTRCGSDKRSLAVYAYRFNSKHQ
ncbi:MAG: hypothetical protein KGO48_07570 [Alphaproteobacteria bacterium]|nr:hypothetical protein [Alphaproteobacteria bacterium]